MIIHVDYPRGDFIINEWDEDGYEQLNKKKEELESLGYSLKKSYMDFLNEYFIYEKGGEKDLTITFCRC